MALRPVTGKCVGSHHCRVLTSSNGFCAIFPSRCWIFILLLAQLVRRRPLTLVMQLPLFSRVWVVCNVIHPNSCCPISWHDFRTAASFHCLRTAWCGVINDARFQESTLKLTWGSCDFHFSFQKWTPRGSAWHRGWLELSYFDSLSCYLHVWECYGGLQLKGVFRMWVKSKPNYWHLSERLERNVDVYLRFMPFEEFSDKLPEL